MLKLCMPIATHSYHVQRISSYDVPEGATKNDAPSLMLQLPRDLYSLYVTASITNGRASDVEPCVGKLYNPSMPEKAPAPCCMAAVLMAPQAIHCCTGGSS